MNISNKTIKRKKTNIFSLGYIILWKIVLDIVYVFVITKEYTHWNMGLNFNFYKYMSSFIIIVLFLIPIKRLHSHNTSSSIIVELLSLAYFFPGCTLYAFNDLDNVFFVYLVVYWCLLLLFYYKIPKLNLGLFKLELNVKTGVFYIIFFGIAIISLLLILRYSGLRFSLSLDDAYSWRRQLNELKIPGVLNYIRVWSVIIVPIGISYFWIVKKRIVAVLLVILQILQYGFDGYRSTLLYLFITIAVLLFYKVENRKIVPVAFIFTGIFTLGEFLLKSKSFFANLLYFRTLFLPPLYSSYYIDFFSNHELDLLRTSILRRFGFMSPYLNYSGFKDYNYLIGYIYNSSLEERANTGMLGDAYANFGWFSLIFYPLIVMVLLKILDYCTDGLDHRIKMIICFLMFIAFTNGSLFQVVLTNGLLIICVLSILIRKQINSR